MLGVIVALLVATAAVAPPVDASFAQAYGSAVSVGTPSALETADFNEDGHDDVIVAADSAVRVLLGNGTGGLVHAPGSPVDLGGAAGPLAVGDFDEDGHADVAVNAGDEVNVLLGDGAGGLTVTGTPLSFTGYVTHLLVTDVNDDFHDDLVVFEQNAGLHLLLGDGSGGLTERPSSPVPVGSNVANAVVVDDFDGDGEADLAVVDGSDNTLHVLLGSGTGSFVAAGGPVVTLPFDGRFAHTTDLDDDGAGDLLVVSTSANRLTVLLGDGTGGFSQPADSPYFVGYAADLEIDDYNGDGKLDVVYAARDGDGLTAMVGNGDGSLRQSNSFGWSPTGQRPYLLAPGDFNEDGTPDVVVGELTSGVVRVMFDRSGTGIDITTSANPNPPDTLLTLYATVASTWSASIPAGTVDFYDGTTKLGTASPSSQVPYQATYQLGNVSLSPGTHMLTARFSGDDALEPTATFSYSQTQYGLLPSPPPPARQWQQPPPPQLPSPPSRSGKGYWMVDATGHVYAFGDAGYYGGLNGARSNVVDLEPTPSGNGYWLLTSAGEIYAFGDARWRGQPSGLTPGETVTSMSAAPNPWHTGYWVFTSRGRAFAFGHTFHWGDMSATALNGPVLDSMATPSGNGYYMVASDGGIFAFGDARFHGSMGGHRLNAPVQSLAPDPDGTGYWLVASDGGVFSFEAPFRGSTGSLRLNKPITGMVPFGNGYLMVGEDGGIFNFSDRPFFGSLGNNPPSSPVVAVAVLDH